MPALLKKCDSRSHIRGSMCAQFPVWFVDTCFVWQEVKSGVSVTGGTVKVANLAVFDLLRRI